MDPALSDTSALVTDLDRRKALPIVRSLGRAGVRVIGLSSQSWPMSGLSKYCARAVRCPDYVRDPDAFCRFLRKVCETERPTVLFPLEDSLISLCLERPDCWKPYTRALLPDAVTMERALDKWQTICFAREQGIPVPQSHCPESMREVEDLADQWSGGAVIKPRTTSGSRGMRIVDDPSGIPDAYREVAKAFSRPIVQQRIPPEGEGLGVSALLDGNQNVLAVFGHRRLREYPIGGGPSTLRVSHRDDRLIEQSVGLLKAMGYIGVAMVEYKVDRNRQEPVLMEINPRFWGSLELAIQAGVNFPLLYHRASAGLKVEPVLDYALDVYCRWLLPGDILHFLKNPNRFHLQPSFFKFRQPNLSYDIISLEDPAPMLGVILESFRRVFGLSR